MKKIFAERLRSLIWNMIVIEYAYLCVPISLELPTIKHVPVVLEFYTYALFLLIHL